MMTAPLVTIIITVYNRREFLPAAVRSALDQTHPRLEVIVVDDGSTIDVREAVGPFEGRIEFCRTPNGGPAAARNHGIRLARGEYALFLDDDDFLFPGAVSALVAAAVANPGAPWIVGRYHYVDRQGRRTGREHLCRQAWGDVYSQMIQNNLVGAPSTVLAQTDVLRQVGGFDENRLIQTCEDYDLWLTLARGYHVAMIPDVVSNYRVYEGNATRDQGRHFNARLQVLAKHRSLARPGFDQAFDLSVARIHRQFGDICYLCGKPSDARLHWRVAALGGAMGTWARRVRVAKSHLPRPMLHALRPLGGVCRRICSSGATLINSVTKHGSQLVRLSAQSDHSA